MYSGNPFMNVLFLRPLYKVIARNHLLDADPKGFLPGTARHYSPRSKAEWEGMCALHFREFCKTAIGNKYKKTTSLVGGL